MVSSKKRIKLLVNQNFPQDFFDTQGDEIIEDKKTYFLRPIPVRVIRSPSTKYKRAMLTENSKLQGDNSSFRSQVYNYLNTEEKERENSPSRSRNILEVPDAANRTIGILNGTQVRSKSTEPGSAGADLGHRRSKSPFIMKRRILDEGGQGYVPNMFPSVYPEHEVRSASGMKRTNHLTQRKDQMTTFRRQRNLVFNGCEDERSPENKPSPPESSHMLVSDSYCWSVEGYAQPDQNDKKVDEEPTKVRKSYSRDNLRRDYESVGYSRPTHHGHYHSMSKEQTLAPIGSYRKIMQTVHTEEADNSRLTSDRDIATQFFSIDKTQGTERNVLPRQAFTRGPVNFNKILLKSIGVNAFDGAVVQQRQPFEKPFSRIAQKECSKENEAEWVKKALSQKIAEQKKLSMLGAPCVIKEGLDFSFSKEYSKQENNDIVAVAPPPKEDKEVVCNPQYPDPSEYRSVGSRSQARMKKKFVLIKRE